MAVLKHGVAIQEMVGDYSIEDQPHWAQVFTDAFELLKAIKVARTHLTEYAVNSVPLIPPEDCYLALQEATEEEGFQVVEGTTKKVPVVFMGERLEVCLGLRLPLEAQENEE